MFLVVVLILTCDILIFGKTEYGVGSERVIDAIHYHAHINENKEIPTVQKNEESASFWMSQATSTVSERVRKSHNTNIAKNVIMFLGDGMSIATLAATRTYLGQINGKTGEETQLSFEKFPYSGFSKTYCVNRQVADSACSATAFLCGVKANEATIGVTAAVKLSDCEAMNDKQNHVDSIAYLSQLVGKRSGIVTTTRITHATPAGTYGHTAHREWESDRDVIGYGKDPQKCIDLARQLVFSKTGQKFNVIFGGGRGPFRPASAVDEHGNPDGWRNDSRDLIDEWKKQKKDRKHAYVNNIMELNAVGNETEFVLGLFATDHMNYNVDRNPKEEPSLQEMTVKAIKLLSQGDKGFFLFVEGGRIDHAHHDTHARIALDETIEFHKAIESAVALTSELDTLIVVTSDHSHTMTINGYPSRGSDILGKLGLGTDRLPYTTLSYANGPSAEIVDGHRPNISEHNFSDPLYQYPSLVPLPGETHAGEDVGIFARGPWAHLFSGVLEQNVIPHVISFASCVGRNGTDSACNHQTSSGKKLSASAVTVFYLLIATVARRFYMTV